MLWWNKQSIPRKLNICFVAQKFPILGRAATHGFLWPIARGLAKKGHKVTILSWKNPKGQAEFFEDGLSAYYLGEGQTTRNFQDSLVKRFKQMHEEDPFEVVHCLDRNGVVLSKLKKQLGFALTYDIDATQMSQIFSIMGMAQDTIGSIIQTSIVVIYKFLTTYWGRDRKLLRSADGVFVTSPQQKIILERHYLYPELKTFVVPYGIEIGDLSPKESSKQLREKLGLPASSHVAMVFSDMTELEEVKNVLKAFELVAIKKPNSRLIIVGNGPLKNLIDYEMLCLALGSKVIFAGAITNVEIPDYISLADIFINISARTSGFEPNLLEAMAQKKVVIGSEVSPISTIIEDGENGFLIRPADKTSLSNLMINVFEGKLNTQEIGEKARNKVTEQFDVDNLVEQTLDAYRKTLTFTGRFKLISPLNTAQKA